jgi:exopolysaccharide/PEP-CTERM locus tyrosine autokinase
MSKIVDALRKIQDDKTVGQTRHRKIARIETNSAVVGRVALDDTAELVAPDSNANKLINIDRDAMRDAGLIAPEAESKLIEDEYRVIKRPLLSNAFGRDAQSVENGFAILVTSALAGDGKTFTCINLGLSMAREKETSVVLVDADMRKPHISTLFDAQDEAGLLDFLDGSTMHPREIELPTNVDGLTIVSTGHYRENATELLSSDRMMDFINGIHRSDPRKIVLIDSSPLLQTTESRALAAISGQVVLVVHAGVTPKGAVTDATSILDANKPVNLVLNQIRHGGKTGYYGNYYGSGYGAGLDTGHGETDAPKNSKN